MTLPIEDVLEGKYEILDKIGEGGIGSVYKVRHRLLDEVRVIKVLRPQIASKEDHQERFLHEARMAIRLKHPNIAQLHDFSISDEGTAFIVMEYIDGIALDALLKANGPPSLELTLEISRQALRALAYLHAHDLVHRDVSPDNLMLTKSFEGGARIKLIDLGIAKNLAEESGLTQTGVFLGKVRYCSPEQFSSTEVQTGELDFRSDLYSFGLLLYELLTGVYPFGGKTFAELAGCHLFQPPISFDESDPEGKISEELREVVLKALEKDPDERHASADAFAQELEGFGGEERSLEDEVHQTVQRTTTAIPNFKQYTKPGSTQDRLNAQFGLGTTAAPDPLTKVSDSGSAPVEPTRSIAFGLPGAKPWIWIGGAIAAAAVVLGLTGWWLIGAGDTEPVADTADADAIEFEATERFALPETEITDIMPKDLEIAPPPLSGQEEGVQPSRAEPSQPPDSGAGGAGASPTRASPGGGPPPGGLPEGDKPPPRRPPPPGPGGPGLGARPTARTPEIYQRGVGVVPPVLMRAGETVYPGGKRPRTEMEVIVSVLVDEFGKVLTANVVKGGGFRRRYKDAAIETAKRSTFRPAMKDGVAGRMWTQQRIVFKTD